MQEWMDKAPERVSQIIEEQIGVHSKAVIKDLIGQFREDVRKR